MGGTEAPVKLPRDQGPGSPGITVCLSSNPDPGVQSRNSVCELRNSSQKIQEIQDQHRLKLAHAIKNMLYSHFLMCCFDIKLPNLEIY